MAYTPQLKHTLPTFLLLSLAGFYFIPLQMILSHAPDRFLEVHKASLVPLAVTHISWLDKILTPLVSFFIAAFGDPSSPAYPTTVDFVWSFSAAIQLPLIEAQRAGACGWLTHPMVWGVLYQRLSGGWILPLWLLAFMHARTRADGAGVERAQAESALFGWWAGHTLPALAILVPGLPPLARAPAWIAFPILMSAAQRAYLLVRRALAGRRTRYASGHAALQLAYASAGAAATAAHIHTVLIPALATSTPTPLAAKLPVLARALVAFFVPASLSVPGVAATTAASGVRHFVQFDVLVVFAAVWIAGVWDLALRRAAGRAATASSAAAPQSRAAVVASEVRIIAGTVVLLLAGALLLSPGAATAALWSHREAGLERQRSARRHDSDRIPESNLDEKAAMAGTGRRVCISY